MRDSRQRHQHAPCRQRPARDRARPQPPRGRSGHARRKLVFLPPAQARPGRVARRVPPGGDLLSSPRPAAGLRAPADLHGRPLDRRGAGGRGSQRRPGAARLPSRWRASWLRPVLPQRDGRPEANLALPGRSGPRLDPRARRREGGDPRAVTGHGILLNLLGGVALLIWATRMVKTGVLRAFGERFRRAIGHATAGLLRACLAGVAVSTAVQSSSATALLVVSFVERGLLALPPALAAMLGADIGSTLVVQALSLNLS